MGHSDTRGDIFREEQLLHRHLVGMEGVDQFFHIVGDLQQPIGQGDARRRGDHTILQQRILSPLRLQNSEADGGHSGINA